MSNVIEKPFSQACENNKAPILHELKRLLAHHFNVLEIGSGTGQHAVHFSQNLPHLRWQTADVAANHEAIQNWLSETDNDNVLSPLELDVNQQTWPSGFDAVFSANTAHIIPWISVTVMITRIAIMLPRNGLFILYGPFKHEGVFTSESNKQFDGRLKAGARHQGIRDFEMLVDVAKYAGLDLQQLIQMPANNEIVVWKKR